MHKGTIIRLTISLLLFLFCPSEAESQDDIRFTIEKIEKDYLPVAEPTNVKQFKRFVRKCLQSPNDTFVTISRLLNFFDDRHLTAFHPVSKFGTTLPLLDSIGVDRIRQQMNANSPKGLEGFWINDKNNALIAILKSNVVPNEFYGYLVRSFDGRYTGKKILRISLNRRTRNQYADWINIEYNYRQISRCNITGDSLIQLSSFSRWHKLKKESDAVMDTIPPSAIRLQVLDSSTVVITIPVNSNRNTRRMAAIVDSLSGLLRNTKLLIVDIRNNAGGSTLTYSKLFPLVYTGPIRRGQGFTYVSDDLIDDQRQQLGEIDSVKNRQEYDEAKLYLDSLVRIRYGREYFSAKDRVFDSVLKNPQHVAVIANYATMSAAEIMILEFRQSKKVTIFGETTAGATDNLSTLSLATPSRKYALWVPTFRLSETEHYGHFQGVGISPSVHIPGSVKDWIKYVVEYYQKK